MAGGAAALLWTATTVVAQQGELRLAVGLSPDSTEDGARNPIIRTSELIEDPTWLNALRSGLPLRLHYRVELWRAQGAWLDDFIRTVEWDVVIQHEPLPDQYSVATVTSRGRRENRYGTLDALSGALARPYRVAVRPANPGRYYYTASLTVSTLSDSDLKEFEQFMRGDLGPATEGDGSLGEALGRGAKRFLLRLAGLPGTRLDARSEGFEVR